MATFIIDRQHQLDNDLVQLFHLDAQAPINHDRDLASSRRHATSGTATTTPPTSRHHHHHHHHNHQGSPPNATTTTTSTPAHDQHREIIIGLRAAIAAIDLRSAALPSMAKVQTELDKISALFRAHPMTRSSASLSSRRGRASATIASSSSSSSSTVPNATNSTASRQRPNTLRRNSSLSSSLTTSSYFAEEAGPALSEAESGAPDAAAANKGEKEEKEEKEEDVDQVVERLEALFLAKCTVAVYLNLMSSLLNATLPLAGEIDYWQGLLESSTWRSMYILQTSPKRMYELTKGVAVRTREHIESLVVERQSDDQDDQEHAATGSHSSRNHLQQMLQWLQYFPTFLSKHLISHPVRFPDAIHYEIGHKKKQLQRIRESQAECLGLLAEQGLHFEVERVMARMAGGGNGGWRDFERHHDGAGVKTREQEEEETAFVVEHVETQLSRTIQLMEQILTKAVEDSDGGSSKADQQTCGEKGCQGLRRSLTLIGRMRGVETLPPSDVYGRLRQLIQTSIPNYMTTTERQAQQYHRPGWLTRFWVPVLMGYFALKFGIQYVSNHRADLDEYLQEAYETARNFVQDWIWEPSKRIMAIIQHRDDQGSLQMLGNESLKSDIASLERMVLDFGKQHSQLSAEQLQNISQAVQNGDISIVMKAYEKELKTPLKGAVAGHLIQTLLIQVQKTKVDIEVAMAALDKLLKANELNFAFLAVGPSLLLLWFITAQVRGVWRRARGRNLGFVSIQMRESLREVERLLNLATPGGGGAAVGASRKKAPWMQPLKVPLVATSSSSGSGRQQQQQQQQRQTRQQQQQPGLLSDSDSSDDSSSSPSALTKEQKQDPAAVRALERRVVASRIKKGKVPYRTQGLVLCEVHLLRTFARQLPKRDGLQDSVMQDLRELEESSLTVHQRLRTAARMYRTYGFLGLYH